MTTSHEEQERRGQLYSRLYDLIGRSIMATNEAMPKLVAEYGAEEVQWVLGVLFDDLEASV